MPTQGTQTPQLNVPRIGLRKFTHNYDLPTGTTRALTITFGTHAATLKVHAFHRPCLRIGSAPVWALFGRHRS